MRIYEAAVRPYLLAAKKSRVPRDAALAVQHEMRVRCAEKLLAVNPLGDYGIERMIGDARDAVAQIVHPSALAWLPDVSAHFGMFET